MAGSYLEADCFAGNDTPLLLPQIGAQSKCLCEDMVIRQRETIAHEEHRVPDCSMKTIACMVAPIQHTQDALSRTEGL